MKLGKKLFASSLLTAAGALVALTVVSGAQADWSGPSGSGDGGTSSTVSTNLWCTWYVNGVDGDISLTPTAGLDAEYEGESFPLAGSVNGQQALVAGWVDGETPTIATQSDYDCSWYNAEKGLLVKVTSTGSGFTAAAATGGDDNAMDFSLTDGPIAVTYTENPDNSCSADWNLASGLTIDSNGDHVDAAKILYSDSMATNESCSWDTTYAVSIPAGKAPTYPGQDYEFTGPTLTTSVEFLSAS